MATIVPEEYVGSVEYYNKWWRLNDNVLYDLCRKHPKHTDGAEVAAKCCIIGRGYATGIERQIASNGRQSGSLTQLIEWIQARGEQVDELIGRLPKSHDFLTREYLSTIVDVHGCFVRLLAGLVRSDETPRSFAAKYLHFHCPLVPIYDSVVAGVIPSLVRWHNDLVVFPKPENAEDVYAWYCYRFWNLYERMRASIGDRVCVKLLDHHLIGLGGGPA